jgi:hypothetical protein
VRVLAFTRRFSAFRPAIFGVSPGDHGLQTALHRPRRAMASPTKPVEPSMRNPENKGSLLIPFNEQTWMQERRDTRVTQQPDSTAAVQNHGYIIAHYIAFLH